MCVVCCTRGIVLPPFSLKINEYDLMCNCIVQRSVLIMRDQRKPNAICFCVHVYCQGAMTYAASAKHGLLQLTSELY